MAFGKLLAIMGVVLVVIGLTMTYAPWLISWFGKLPGDIRIEDDRKAVFIPITSMILKTSVEYIPANKNQHKLDKEN